jgi:hypothetical protein
VDALFNCYRPLDKSDKQAYCDDHTDIIVIQKRTKAEITFTMTDKVLLENE